MTELKDMMVERLQAYRLKNNKFPSNVLFFRDGVSEGQFAQVKAKEVPQIVEACEEVAGKDVKINITFIIVSKRHNTRLFKKAQTDKQFLDQRQEISGLVWLSTTLSLAPEITTFTYCATKL